MKKIFLWPLVLLTSIGACASVPVDLVRGETDAYTLTAGEMSIGKNSFTSSGLHVKAESLAPKIASVKVVIFDDENGDGVWNQGEQKFAEKSSLADPPSTEITTGSISGDKSAARGGTTWHATIVNESGGTTTHGGTF